MISSPLLSAAGRLVVSWWSRQVTKLQKSKCIQYGCTHLIKHNKYTLVCIFECFKLCGQKQVATFETWPCWAIWKWMNPDRRPAPHAHTWQPRGSRNAGCSVFRLCWSDFEVANRSKLDTYSGSTVQKNKYEQKTSLSDLECCKTTSKTETCILCFKHVEQCDI